MQRWASSGPQKYITKDSDGFHNHFTPLTMIELRTCHLVILPKIHVFFFSNWSLKNPDFVNSENSTQKAIATHYIMSTNLVIHDLQHSFAFELCNQTLSTYIHFTLHTFYFIVFESKSTITCPQVAKLIQAGHVYGISTTKYS